MKYSIITLNSFGAADPRYEYKKAIHENVPYVQWWLQSFNAHLQDPVAGANARGLEIHSWGNAKRGELGVWLSNYDHWSKIAERDEPSIVFEDDAVVRPDFKMKFERFMAELPDDWDFASLWVPGNQLVDYDYEVEYDHAGNPMIGSGRRYGRDSYYWRENTDWAAFVYQGYGMVSLVYSPQGAAKLVDLAHSRGIDGPVDCWVYQEAHKGNLNGFAPYPWTTPIVDYDWNAQSHVQQTERAL